MVFIRSQIDDRRSIRPSAFPQRQQGEATGSGFVIDKQGHIAHQRPRRRGREQDHGRLRRTAVVNAKLVGKDTSNDIALLKVNVDKDTLDAGHARRLGQGAGR